LYRPFFGECVVQVFSKKCHTPLKKEKWDNYKNAKIGWVYLKILFTRTTASEKFSFFTPRVGYDVKLEFALSRCFYMNSSLFTGRSSTCKYKPK
jgi:hypothetical protein